MQGDTAQKRRKSDLFDKKTQTATGLGARASRKEELVIRK